MEAQEKSEWRKGFLGSGKHLGVSQSEASSIERKQEEISQGRVREGLRKPLYFFTWFSLLTNSHCNLSLSSFFFPKAYIVLQ